MAFRPLPLLLLAAMLVACSDDPAASPGSTTVAPPGPPTEPSIDSATAPGALPEGSATTAAPAAPSSTVAEPGLPERCVARTGPMYPNPATERWVPSPETGDVITDFALLVLGWPDVTVEEQQPDGPVTLVRITSSASPRPVELILLPDADGRPASVCGARSALDGEVAASVLIEGRRAVSGFGIVVDPDDTIPAAIHELFPDVVSAQLLISHGPHVQQAAATDPEKGWDFELDHPTTEPGWQMAFWRDADGAALVVMDTGLPAGN